MGDSAAVLWESELLRARQWLAASLKDKQQENEQLFQRVKMHIGFIDHQRSLQSEAVTSEDEDDMALDFLGDVDASDMNTLLQAEAAKAAAAAVPCGENVLSAESHIPSAKDLMMPLEMPTDLVSPDLKPMAQLDPKRATTATAGLTTLGNEARVQELMQELELDVTQHLDFEEGKTEESTPPHILKAFGEMSAIGNHGAEQSKYMREVSSKSPQAPHKKKADAFATMQRDDVAQEMLSWVSGYRDPEVIRRKENMRRTRKLTHRYGVASEEERRQVLMQVKKITHDSKDDSGSESGDNMSSEYSPAEDEETSELDENEVIGHLSDDCLDDGDEIQHVKQKRKRLRQTDDLPKKKKSRSRKPIVTRKLTLQSLTSQNSDIVEEVQPIASSEEGKAKTTLATANSTLLEADPRSKSSRPVVLLSSEDETEANNSISKAEDHKSTSRHGTDGISSNAAEPAKTMELTVLRDNHLQKESDSSKVQQNCGSETEKTQTAPILKVSEAVSEDRACESIGSDSVALEPNETVDSPTANESAYTDDTDLSDTETLNLEDEELLLQSEEHFDEKVTAATATVVLGSGIAVKQVNTKRVEELLNDEPERSLEAGDEDVSEAETETLDDDEPSTDFGLDCSDDSYSRSNQLSEQQKPSLTQFLDSNDKAGAERDVSGTNKSGTENETKATHAKQEASKNQEEDKASASTTGVQKFFDFAPLKLKSKVKTVSFTTPKPLPVHSKVENSNDENILAKFKKTPVKLTTPSIGSNGLRPSKRTIATTTTTKGKYLVTRRCTKVLDDAPETKRQSKGQYTMVFTKKSRGNGRKDLDDVPLANLAKELLKKSEDTPQTRYLSYAGAKKTEEPTSYVAEATHIVSKSRFGGGGGLSLRSSTAQYFPAASNGRHQQMTDKEVSTGGYRREPQISIYDALHMDRQESASDTCKVTGYKRPSRFKKMQEEEARSSTPIVKSQWQDKDWDKIPIPKKKKQARQDEDALLQPSKTIDLNTRSGAGNLRVKRHKKNFASSNKTSGSSYYGPRDTSGKHDLPSRERRGQERSKCRRNNDQKKKRSPSPPSKGRYDRKHRLRDDHRNYSNNRYHSRSWSQERSSERDHRRPDRIHPIGRDDDRNQETNRKRRSLSPEDSSSSKKKMRRELAKQGEIYENGEVEDTGSSAKQKISHSTSPRALPTFDDESMNVFISDSDDDENALIEEVEDIRFDLDSIPVDAALMTRQVYVTGLNPSVCAEQIEEDFARFGVGVDAETGFPAIEVFACQRNYLGRGDACVTFKTEEGAQEAVEELNSKNVKNSMIHVRRMDVHTQRILSLQFQAVRDTWKCTRTHCRADVSVWNAKCDKCGRKRAYGPSNIKIGAESWLCSLCFTANESFATSCSGCMESLPEMDRSTFYTS